MDDDLKAIQADLDSVLDRLGAYINRDKPAAESAITTPQEREDAARVVLHYVRSPGPLEWSVHVARDVSLGRWQGSRVKPKSRLRELEDTKQPEGLAPLVEAMSALCEWPVHRYPLESKHLLALARAINAWSNKQCQFIGENFGIDLTPKRQVDRRAGAREGAAHQAFALHQKNPEAYPISEALFEKAGKWYGMSARTVARAYYNCDSLQDAREFIKKNPPRKLSENDET